MTGWSGPAAAALAGFEEAAHDVVALVRRLDTGGGTDRAADWSVPGLGVWDLRALVGHTSRALITVATYLDVPATTEDLATAADYVVATTALTVVDPAAVAERGRQAGRELGADPAAALEQHAATAIDKVRGSDPEAIIHTAGGGMRVRSYLPTRTFELVVHGFDIADAAGIVPGFGSAALVQAVSVAAEAAAGLGQGPGLLRALAGRGPWPDRFSVVS